MRMDTCLFFGSSNLESVRTCADGYIPVFWVFKPRVHILCIDQSNLESVSYA